MELPAVTEWALHCCWLLGQSEGTRPIPRRSIAAFFDLPEPYFAKVLKRLVAAGVLSSVPGAGGGYLLARAADEITALQIVQAVGGGRELFHCAELRQRGPEALTPAQCTTPCGIARAMHEAELAYRRQLSSTTLAALIEQASPASEARAARWLGALARPAIRRSPASSGTGS